MEIVYITTVSLVWFIYIFLFGDADKQVLDVFNRLKFALSIDRRTHAVKLELLEAHGRMGIPEIIDYGNNMSQSDPTMAKNIKWFENCYKDIENFKNILILNLFLLTIHALMYSIFCISTLLFVQLHIVLSLFLGMGFYWYIKKRVSRVVFSKIEYPL